jgi:hypothetical protein
MSIGASLALNAADKPPEFDVTASCKAVAAFGLALQHSPEACISDENAAHAELKQKWETYSATERSRCVDETMIASPSYVDILTCLQMAQDAEALNSPLVGASKRKRGIK